MFTEMMHAQPAIVCLAHLGWDFVWQRPQQILSRLAEYLPVLYINEPFYIDNVQAQPALLPVAAAANLSAWQPEIPAPPAAHQHGQTAYFQLVEDLLVEQGWLVRTATGLQQTRPLIVWFYTPAPVAILERLPTSLVVYDVMDELASFRFAATDLPRWEDQLLTKADLVFTGGRSLYTARKQRHPHVHLFASGVDPAHFAQALDPAVPRAEQLAHTQGPILGYYGVIDERIDIALLEALALAYPEMTFVMVGPTAKIDPASLPALSNILYPGKQPYEDLPRFLKAFDICLMPFALNEATRSISPTKALEYMAAHKPVISTPVPDVVANWSKGIWIAANHAEFIATIQQVLAETPEQRQQRFAWERMIVEQNTWDYIAQSMLFLITTALNQQYFPHTEQLAERARS